LGLCRLPSALLHFSKTPPRPRPGSHLPRLYPPRRHPVK